MLKIKDEVDLKELEKFGFIKHSKLGVWFKIVGAFGEAMTIGSKRQILYQADLDGLRFELWNETIFDLIQAGLVEKE